MPKGTDKGTLELHVNGDAQLEVQVNIEHLTVVPNPQTFSRDLSLRLALGLVKLRLHERGKADALDALVKALGLEGSP